MAEQSIQQRILATCAKGATRLFRNNVGTGWAGKVFRPSRPMVVNIGPDDVIVRNARPLHAGLCNGSSDLIGWTSVEITPDMIGQRVAVFTALEVKAKTGRATDEQTNFVDVVNRFGGIAAIVRSVQDALDAIGRGRA